MYKKIDIIYVRTYIKKENRHLLKYFQKKGCPSYYYYYCIKPINIVLFSKTAIQSNYLILCFVKGKSGQKKRKGNGA